MIKWHSLKVPWLANNQTSLELRIKWTFRGGKNKSSFRHFDSSWEGKRHPLRDNLCNAGPTQVSPAASARNIVTCPHLFNEGNRKFPGDKFRMVKNEVNSEICSIVRPSPTPQNHESRARPLAPEPVIGQRKVKSPRKICEIARKSSAREIATNLEATTFYRGRVNMDRYFLFLVVHDDDPATQKGTMNSKNLLVVWIGPVTACVSFPFVRIINDFFDGLACCS